MIRTGEESLFAEGVFDLSEEQVQRLKRIGFDIEDNELIISRYFDRNSKSKVTVNGIRMTVSKLKELMSHILDLVGQHEHQFLLNKNYHLGLLDKFLNKDGTDTVKKIREKHRLYHYFFVNLQLQIKLYYEFTRISRKGNPLRFRSTRTTWSCSHYG